MRYTFRKGDHRPTFSFPWLHTGKNKTFTVTFSAACWYQDTDRERDWNKLVGWSYGFLPRKIDGKWKPAHHVNSERLVWRPHVVAGFIEVGLYQYVEGNIDYSTVSEVALVQVEVPATIPLSSKPQWGYTLSPFHGGTFPAPQDYTISIT